MTTPDEPSRYELRSRRRRLVRAKTIDTKRMTKRELREGALLYPAGTYERPRTRGDCENGVRPCPFVTCPHHLFLDVSEETGSIKLNFPDLDPNELPETCALDVAEQGGETLEVVGELMNITRERLRQIEVAALAKLRSGLAALVDGEERTPCRVLPDNADPELDEENDL